MDSRGTVWRTLGEFELGGLSTRKTGEMVLGTLYCILGEFEELSFDIIFKENMRSTSESKSCASR